MKKLLLLLIGLLTLNCYAQNCTVTSSTLNLRSAPGKSGQILVVLAKGQHLNIIAASGTPGWVRVEADNTRGYVAKQYLSCGSGAAKKSEPKKSEAKVWICESNSAYAYHNSSNCRGLNRCRSGIGSVNESEAKSSYGRRPCKICY